MGIDAGVASETGEAYRCRPAEHHCRHRASRSCTFGKCLKWATPVCEGSRRDPNNVTLDAPNCALESEFPGPRQCCWVPCGSSEAPRNLKSPGDAVCARTPLASYNYASPAVLGPHFPSPPLLIDPHHRSSVSTRVFKHIMRS